MVDQAIPMPLLPEGILEKGWETLPIPLALEIEKPREFGVIRKARLESSRVGWPRQTLGRE